MGRLFPTTVHLWPPGLFIVDKCLRRSMHDVRKRIILLFRLQYGLILYVQGRRRMQPADHSCEDQPKYTKNSNSHNERVDVCWCLVSVTTTKHRQLHYKLSDILTENFPRQPHFEKVREGYGKLVVSRKANKQCKAVQRMNKRRC
jgi:hypothetical protein